MSKAAPPHKDKLMHGRHIGNVYEVFSSLFAASECVCVCASGERWNEEGNRTTYVRLLMSAAHSALAHQRWTGTGLYAHARTHQQHIDTMCACVCVCSTADVTLDT